MTDKELLEGIMGILGRLYDKYGERGGSSGIALIIREDGSGIVKDVPWVVSDSRVVYDFDLLAELVDKFGVEGRHEMKVSVGEPVTGAFKSTYVAEMTFMHGDADDETVREVALEDLDKVFDLVLFDKEWWELEYFARRNRIDGKDNEGIMAMTGFDTLFQGNIENWPQDNTSWDLMPERHASYMGYQLFWYNEDGLKHSVEITEGG